MADVIKFQCGKCGKKMGVRPEYAGKKVRCAGCQEPTRVPSPRPARAATGVPVGAGVTDQGHASSSSSSSEISLEELAAMEHSAQVQTVEMTGRSGPRSGAPQVQNGKPCPSCSGSVKQDAVLCIHCGYNFTTGKQFKTKQDSAIGKVFSAAKGDGEGAGNRPFYTGFLGLAMLGFGIATLLFDYDPTTANRRHKIINGIINFTYENIGAGGAAAVFFILGIGLFVIAAYEMREKF